MKRRLIVNADDLGRTVGINDGVFEAHQGGIVTSATLMVAYPAAEGAARRTRELPRLGLGLHLALTGGRPVSPANEIPSLVDNEGRLARHRMEIGDPDPSDLRREITAQLDRFRELTGGEPTHVDGHHHCHRVPAVLEALLEILAGTGLPVRSVDAEVAARLRAAGVPTTDRFDEDFYDEGVTLSALLAQIRGLPAGTSELMCHPGRVDGELAASTYSAPREREIELLTHPEVRAAVEGAEIELIHFGEL